MRTILLALAAAIFVGAIVVSYTHVHALMAFAGLYGVVAHLTVVVMELTFIAGTLAYAWNAVPRPVSLSAIGLGLAITLSGNVLDIVGHDVLSQTGGTIVGVGIGMSIPLALIISEVLIKQFLAQGHSRDNVQPISSENTVVCTIEELKATMSIPAIERGPGQRNLSNRALETVPVETEIVPEVPVVRMTKRDRHERLRTLSRDMSIAEMADSLGVTTKTIRRDINELGIAT